MSSDKFGKSDEPIKQTTWTVTDQFDQVIIPATDTDAKLHKTQQNKLTVAGVERILETVAAGRSLVKACALEGLTSTWPFLKIINQSDEWSALYASAKEARAEHFVDEILTLADSLDEFSPVEKIAGVKLQVNTRQWLAAKLFPDSYGDKVKPVSDTKNARIDRLVSDAGALVKKIRQT